MVGLSSILELLRLVVHYNVLAFASWFYCCLQMAGVICNTQNLSLGIMGQKKYTKRGRENEECVCN